MLLRFGGIAFVLALALWLYCLLDAISSDRDRVRNLPKGAWVAIVLLTFEIGSVLWLVAGRPRAAAGGASGGASATQPGRRTGPGDAWSGWARPQPPDAGRTGPPAPDDDPEFLARLDREVSSEHEDLLDKWEEDLRRREDELRRREGGEDGEPRPDSPTR